MTSEIPMVNQDDDLVTIVEKFSHSDSHRLIVVDAQGRAVGLLSDSDVVARIQPARRRSVLDAFRGRSKPPTGKETAFDLMSAGPLTAPPDLTLVEAVQKMLKDGRKWLVVIDQGGKPLGLVDRQMLLQSLASYYRGD